MYLKGVSGMSNGVDPNLTSRSVTFDLGLHSLLKCVCSKTLCNYHCLPLVGIFHILTIFEEYDMRKQRCNYSMET